jgi:RNA ligase
MLKSEVDSLGLKTPKTYEFKDLDQILSIAKKLSQNEEGFVIQFSNGVRIKIKGDEYVRIHRLISRVTPLAVWECLLNGDDLAQIKKDLPEELQKDFDQITSILLGKLNIFIDEVETMYENTKNLSDKELGIYMSMKPEAFAGRIFPESQKYIFMRRKGKFYSSLNNYNSMARRSMFNVFKPKSNVLPGYTPSSVINRFDLV